MGIALFWIGELSGEYFSLYMSSWLILVGILWIHLGWRKVRAFGFPLLILLAMFPLPHFLYGKVSFQLKLFSSRLGVWVMQAFGMSAYREGNLIDLGFTQLQVVDACSGLRYLIPLIVLGILVAYLFKGAMWKKLVLILSTVPIAIFVNGLRVASVGILYQYFGRSVAEGFFHDFSGWVIFLVSFAMLLGIAAVLKRDGVKGSDQNIEAESSKLKAESNGEEMVGEEKGISSVDFEIQNPKFRYPESSIQNRASRIEDLENGWNG